MTRLLLLSAIVVTAARVAQAQPVDEATYVERALAADPRTRAAEAGIADAAADEALAATRENPSLSGDREHVLGDGGEVEHVIALDVPVDLSGRRGRRVAAARSRIAAARAMRDAADVEVALDARAAYRVASYLRGRAAILAAGRDDLVRAVDVVRARVEAGDAAEHELERAELELVEYDDELAEAELDRDAAERELGARLGGGPIETTGEVRVPAPSLDTDAARSPGAIALDHLDDAARADASAAARGWFPELVVRGGARSLTAGDDTRWGYVVGVAIEIPLFDRGAADVARARATRRRVDAAREGLAERTAARIAAARDHLDRRTALAERSTVERAERVATLIRAAEAAYREGGPLVDLLDAYRLHRRAQLRALELRHGAALAEIDLWRAIGRAP